MGEMTRAQSLWMWEEIAKGIFRDVGGTDRWGNFDPPSGYEIGAYNFIEEVAKAIIEADKLPAKKRSDALMKALCLDGRMRDDELALRNAIKCANYFPPEDDDGNLIPMSETEMRRRILKFYRHELGFKKPEHDETLDDERIRQIRDFMKKNQL